MVDLLWDHPWDHPPGAWNVIDVYVGFGTYIIVGRSPHCNIVIDHPSVSGRHLVITFSSNIRFRLLDMRSTNGTWFWTRHGRWKRVPRHGFAARWGGMSDSATRATSCTYCLSMGAWSKPVHLHPHSHTTYHLHPFPKRRARPRRPYVADT